MSYSAFQGQPADTMFDGFSDNFNSLLESLNFIPHQGKTSLYEKVPLRERQIVVSISDLHCNKDIHLPSGPLGKKSVFLFVKYRSEETIERFIRHGSLS